MQKFKAGTKCLVLTKKGKLIKYYVKTINGMDYFANSKTIAITLSRNSVSMVSGMQYFKKYEVI